MKQLTASLMVLIMSFVIVNRALYIHIHLMPNGSLVSHAHPFSKTADDHKAKDHQHSSLELFLLDQLDIITI
ncbi:MAG: hypothetical protein P1P86_10320 [Bacteroidales bacterium]|nr:hypothetical protein [Bacteroidales bacterium]